MKLSFSAKWAPYGVLGLAGATLSICRVWRGDSRQHPTWRHITLNWHSFACRQPGRLYRDGRARWTWHRLRFGFGHGNLYLGCIYLITTFGRQHPPLRYRKFGGIFEWAWQPTMDEYLRERRP